MSMNFIFNHDLHVLFPSPFSCSSVTFSWPLGASVILRAKKGKGRVQGWECHMENIFIKNQTWKWHTKGWFDIFMLKKKRFHTCIWEIGSIWNVLRWPEDEIFCWTEVTFAREKLWDFFRQENSHHNPLLPTTSKIIIFFYHHFCKIYLKWESKNIEQRSKLILCKNQLNVLEII